MICHCKPCRETRRKREQEDYAREIAIMEAEDDEEEFTEDDEDD